MSLIIVSLPSVHSPIDNSTALPPLHPKCQVQSLCQSWKIVDPSTSEAIWSSPSRTSQFCAQWIYEPLEPSQDLHIERRFMLWDSRMEEWRLPTFSQISACVFLTSFIRSFTHVPLQFGPVLYLVLIPAFPLYQTHQTVLCVFPFVQLRIKLLCIQFLWQSVDNDCG